MLLIFHVWNSTRLRHFYLSWNQLFLVESWIHEWHKSLIVWIMIVIFILSMISLITTLWTQLLLETLKVVVTCFMCLLRIKNRSQFIYRLKPGINQKVLVILWSTNSRVVSLKIGSPITRQNRWSKKTWNHDSETHSTITHEWKPIIN